ncbi:MAG: aminopeptidase P family protein [Rhodospirillaceae bacterium]|jgi:Xaa-Pro dipeptidase|nr:aminopeptidase P family protein [Rhodospirillaceae bacterium]MBT5245709.1 aminopeptidase P family protein [Rhodospirillaceae bacterium]MBT6240978.1 aminopeptidase P family protein [Rhodospirillaceae bacterium]MBT7138444.1 aminopeptidase P family protein [Rhodospirillaceae bacterium]
MFSHRMETLRGELAERDIDVALITDDDSVYYFTGYYDYLHMDFGRPTILVVPKDGDSLLVTPSMEMDMAGEAARVERIAVWNDGMGDEWRAELPGALEGAGRVAIEPTLMPALVRDYVQSLVSKETLDDITPLVADMRMIKSAEELQLARHAGQVAMAMMDAGRAALGDGVAEFEVALATNAAGTRKAAELLDAHYDDTCMSPNTHFLQIMSSGKEITKPHHRASTRIIRRGEPVFLCFCGMTNFHRFKLGFDRTFWIGEVPNDEQAQVYQVAVDSQAAALKVLRPGIAAQDVHAAYAAVIEGAGYDYPFRCGRATGYSFLEKPELVFGDETILRPGMVLAVDGSVSVAKTFRAQVGDSFIVTEDGYEQITNHAKALPDMII